MQNIKRFFIKFARFIRFLTANFKGVLLFIFILYLIVPSSPQDVTPANLVRIDLKDEIMDATKVAESIDEAAKDKDIKGVLFVVSSPGGAVAPSIEIAYAIKRLSAVKPVITYAAGTIASGSYYASIYSNKIIANPGSIVGSIGVIMQGFNVKGLTDKVGVSTQTVKAGEFKEAGTMSRPWTKEERDELKTMVDDTYATFVQEVATARKLDIKDEKEFANAHIFSAYRALKLGLIDEVATIYEAKERLVTLSGVAKANWKKSSPIELFMDRLESSFTHVLKSSISDLVLK